MGQRRAPTRLLSLAVLLAVLLFSAVVSAAPPVAEPSDDRVTGWLGADGEPLPFETPDEMLVFLRDAKIVSSKTIKSGINQPKKLLLELDGVQAHAVFRDVDVSQMRVQLDDGTFHMRLRDFALFEVAAYRMAALLGIDNVPPTVERRIAGQTGSVQLWIENVISAGGLEPGVRPPSYSDWAQQFQGMEIFDYLILNIDRNQGNFLIDSNFKIWFIDHTRSFQIRDEVPSPEAIVRANRQVWQRLASLDEPMLRATFKNLLSPAEISGVMQRVDALRIHVQSLIDDRGERDVIF